VLRQIVLWSIVVIVLLILFRGDGSDDCSQVKATYGEASTEYRNCRSSSSYRSGGGSFGGYSSGGGHK
jgi:hypothetical protein